MHPVIQQVTDRIRERGTSLRADYVARMQAQAVAGRPRGTLACGNLAHVVAACSHAQKTLLDMTRVNVGIVTAYNDLLSAHQPYEHYPEQIKAVLSAAGHSALRSRAAFRPCDGVTQGQAGMDLSLFSRVT